MAETINRLANALVRLDPALYIRLQDEHELEDYLTGFEDIESLVSGLPPSAHDFLEDVLEQDFRSHWLLFHEAGIIRYEMQNICSACEATLQEFGWPEADDSSLLYYAVITAIDDYLQEGGKNGL
ncbi:hypothetical protein [Mucilaginibacter polytrichastri]|uniref:Uncharacterized protein n=1 Tax=Mucilaginibacter polytrichastri TaxID=1302689 RepID=A0A1Q6A460_9SPHI|nr:hypothetical protein [Mucilaginibacter polytrichastri]OKS88801.1 hypothetical protein RG47T_4279 [Mucilaginibacter polytrichastri]SFT05837.1 hypothetical protein SAMN04487890_109133 [Mucilaginibacter polytrichastri]